MRLSPKPLMLRKIVVALCAAGAAGLLPMSSQAAEKLKIATTVWAGNGPLYVADKLDLYKAYDLKVDLQFFSDPAMSTPAMASGAIDGSALTYDQVIAAVAQGHKHKAVMPIDFSNGGDAIVTDVSITSIEQLKGKKVGVAPLSPPEFLLTYALQSKGLTHADIKPININPDAVPGAMASGGLLAGVTWEPNVSRVVGMGGGQRYHVLYSSKEAPGLITDVLAFDEKVIEKRGKAIESMIKGYLDGLAYMHSHPVEATAIIAEVLGVSPAEAAEQMAGVYNMPLAEMPKNFEATDATTSFYGSGAIIAKLMLDSDQIGRIPAPEETFDDRFIKALSQ
jgi:NitT/TauT family transport system substrate-binding protein